MNPTALMQMQDTTPAGEDGIIREADLGLDRRPVLESAHRWRRAGLPQSLPRSTWTCSVQSQPVLSTALL